MDPGRSGPFPREVHTERLVLRATSTVDAADQADAVAASLDRLKQWMPWAREPQSREQAAANLAAGAEMFDAGTEFHWTIRSATTEEFLGRVSLFAITWAVPKGEVGYWLSSAHTGSGYMREAVGRVVGMAEEAGFRRIEIRCDRPNVRSARVAESLGFTRDAVLHNDEVSVADPAVLRDTLVFSRTR